MAIFKEFVGERVNLHLKDGSVIVNVLLTKLGKRHVSYKVHKADIETFKILKRDVDFARKIPLETLITLEKSLSS